MFLLKPKWMIPIAIIPGLLATFGVFRFLQKEKEDSLHRQTPMKKVVVAAKNLPMSTTLESNMLRLTDWPADLVTEATFTEIDSVINRVIKTDVYIGEAILNSKLAPRGSSGGLLSLIPAGMRAMTVAVNVVSGVSGFILPHTRVDVMVTVSSSGKKEEAMTRIILEDVEVLAVDQTFLKGDDDAMTVQSVTLLVWPEQAEKLALGSNEGKLQLTLRNMIDRQASASGSGSSGIRLRELITSGPPAQAVRTQPRVVAQPQAPPPVVETAPSPKVIEVLRSNVRTEVLLEGGTAKEEKTKK